MRVGYDADDAGDDGRGAGLGRNIAQMAADRGLVRPEPPGERLVDNHDRLLISQLVRSEVAPGNESHPDRVAGA
jgi:hypothetical protein